MSLTPSAHESNRQTAKKTLKKTKLLTLAILATGVASLIILPSSARASDWVGGTSTDWNNSANWSSGLPNSGSDWAYIYTGTSNVPVISSSSTGSPVLVAVGNYYATGRLNQTAGILTGTASDWPGGAMLIGYGDGSNGTYNIANTTTTGGAFTGYGTGSGSYTTGQWGDIRVAAGYWWNNSTAVMNINTSGTVQANGHMLVASANGDNGTVNIDAGTVSVAGGWNGSNNTSMEIACGSGTSTVTGSLNVSGGTVSLSYGLLIGNGNAGATGVNVGTVTMTGGTLKTGTNAIGQPWYNGVDMASAYGSSGDNAVGGTATFNLNGGTLTTPRVFSLATSGTDYTATAGTSTFNFNGGTLKVQTGTPSFANLMGGLTRANVRNGGAVIDTNGVDSYITQALQHSNIGGDAATDGGLTKNGDGQLTMNTGCSFTGQVVVNQGTLYAAAPDYAGGTFAASSGITVNGGAVLKANNNSLFTQYNTYDGGKPITVNAGAAAYTMGGQQFVGLVTLNGGELGSSGAIGSNGSWTFGHFSSDMKLAVTDDSIVSADKVAFYNGANIDVATGKTLTFDGTIANSGTNVTSLIKTGSGTMIVNGSNSYTGSTTVNNGTLALQGSLTSAVTVNAGRLSGTGRTTGAVVIGNGAGGSDAFLSPGNSPGTFTTTSTLSLLSDATFVFDLNSTNGSADKVVANGISINSSALFAFNDLGNGSGILSGQTFTVIDNTSGSAISGTFANLQDGASIVSNGITYTASYSGGGNGKSLVLTANPVPEPSTWAMLAAGTGFFLILRRRSASSRKP